MVTIIMHHIATKHGLRPQNRTHIPIIIAFFARIGAVVGLLVAFVTRFGAVLGFLVGCVVGLIVGLFFIECIIVFPI
jgi:hypothetical protein